MNDAKNDQPDADEPGGQPELVEQIVESLKQGNKIQAIKDYRDATGAGLKESKDVIDSLIQKYEISMKSGCASMLLFAFHNNASAFHCLRR